MSQFDSPTPAEFDTTGEPPAWPKVVGYTVSDHSSTSAPPSTAARDIAKWVSSTSRTTA